MTYTRLYIENEEVELLEDIQFAITKQFEDLNNPTKIINDWSKTVDIPFSKKNNEIFGNAFNIDKSVDLNQTLLKYNPSTTVDFRLDFGNNVLMSGYLKLNSISRKNGSGSYNVTLYGKLGEIFNKMKKITFENTYDDYQIYGYDYFTLMLNADNIHKSFNTNQESLELHNVTEPEYKWTDIIGFAPSNAYKSLFDYTQYTDPSNNSVHKITESIDNKDYSGQHFVNFLGYTADNLLPEGKLKPRDFGEFRGWLQLPYIYFNKLFQIFNKKTELVTGYKVILNDKWFNKNNAYWKHLVMMLNTVEDSKDAILNNLVPLFEWFSYEHLYTTKNKNLVLYGQLSDLPKIPLVFEITIRTLTDIPDGAIVSLSSDSQFNVSSDEKGRDSYNNPYGSIEDFSYLRAPEEPNTGVFGEMKYIGNNEYSIQIVVPFDFSFFYSRVFKDISLSIGATFSKISGEQNDSMFSYYYNGVEYPITWDYVSIGNQVFNSTRNLSSDITVTLNDLWDNKKNLFDIILNYCKLFRIGVFVDDLNKTIEYKPLKEYFKEYTIEDWTNKIDFSKDFTIEYILSDKKYLLFNTGENKSDLNTQYKSKTGLNYGEFKFDTGYNFNDETESLFKNPKSGGIIYTPYILSINDLLGIGTPDGHPRVAYTLPNEGFVCDYSEDNKHTSVFGQMFFDMGIGRFQYTLNVPSVRISNDSPSTKSLDKKIYLSPNYTGNLAKSSEYYHWLLSAYDGYDIPAQMGYSINNGAEQRTFNALKGVQEKDIYHIFWDSYLTERFLSGAKRINCYVNINLIDFYNYKPNRFIKINNQLCLLNKIYDFTLSSNVTKCEFITINNLNNFIENDFQTESIQLSAYMYEAEQTDATQVTMIGSGYWEIENIQELNNNNINCSITSGELNGQGNPIDIIISTNNTPIGIYYIKFRTTGYYGDPFEFKFKLIVK